MRKESFLAGIYAGVGSLIGVYVALSWSPSVVLFCFMLILFAAPVLFDMARGRFDLFEVRNVFMGLMFLNFVVGAGNAIYFGRYWVDDTEFSSWLNLTLIYANLSVISYYAGYYTTATARVAAWLPSTRGGWPSRRVAVAVIVLTIAGLGAHVALLESNGGLGSFVAHASDSASVTMGKYYLLLPATRLPLLAIMICYLHGRSSQSPPFKRAAIALLLVNLIKQLTLGGRTVLVLAALGLCGIAHYVPGGGRRAPILLKVILVPACAAGLFMFLAVATVVHNLGPSTYSHYQVKATSLAYSVDGIESGLEFLGFSGIAELIVERFSTFESFLRVISRTGRVVPAAAGRTFLDVVYTPIPRILWRDKPYDWLIGFASDYLDFDTTTGEAPLETPVATWPGELYINFLLPGLILGMFFTGAACRCCYEYFLRNRNEPVLLFYILEVVFLFPSTDGGLSMAVFAFAACAVPAAIACLFFRNAGTGLGKLGQPGLVGSSEG